MAIRIAIFIDAANLEKSTKKLGFKVHYRRLLRLFYAFGEITYAGYYTVLPESYYQKVFVKSLTRFGYTVKSKPLKVIHHFKSNVIRKANFDVEIAVDAIQMIDNYDLMVMFSGDGDFTYLINKLKLQDKKVLVISAKHHIARELIEVCDQYLDLRKLRQDIQRQTQSPAFGLGASPGAKSSLETAIESILTD